MERTMRRIIGFNCGGDALVGTLDEADGTTGLLIVSGGNEIRSGAFAGQALMADLIAQNGYPVFRYDRRGIGDSDGVNTGFEGSAEDIAYALSTFRAVAPHVNRIVAFGNCDAASALALFNGALNIEALVLANPWVIEAVAKSEDTPTPPSAAAIRARYWARLKNPSSLLDLLTGKINLKKLAGGLASAARKEPVSGLALRISQSLSQLSFSVIILIASRDTTALAFLGAWAGDTFKPVREKANIQIDQLDTASHGFADAAAKDWLFQRLRDALRA
jgi:exosortase A-associated hydrolase 1